MGSEAKVVGLMADPGVPQKIDQSVAGSLKRELADRIEDIEWHFEVSTESFSLTPTAISPSWTEPKTCEAGTNGTTSST